MQIDQTDSFLWWLETLSEYCLTQFGECREPILPVPSREDEIPVDHLISPKEVFIEIIMADRPPGYRESIRRVEVFYDVSDDSDDISMGLKSPQNPTRIISNFPLTEPSIA